jgi:uncharacterized protein
MFMRTADPRPLRWRLWLLAMTLVASMTAPSFSHASPSFVCGPKLSRIEKAICGDVYLATWDSALAWVYEKQMATYAPVQRAALIAEQRAWLASRETLCPDQDPTACLQGLYKKRTHELEKTPPQYQRGFGRIADSGVALAPGTTATFSGMDVTCESNRVSMRFYGLDDADNPRHVNRLRGDGDLLASFADCRLNDGTSIRVKAGFQNVPMAYGWCGASPNFQLSVWINQHKRVSALAYTSNCQTPYVSSMSIDRTGVGFCLKDDAFNKGASKEIFRVEHGSCGHIAMAAGNASDRNEFPEPGVTLPPVGSFSLTASGAIGKVCEQIIAQRGDQGLKPPSGTAVPDWQKMDTERMPHPDVSKVGYNATTLSDGQLLAADFDLANTGVVARVYASDQTSHWFDGSALAVDREGILVTPFDAHDWDASIKKGIYTFVYEHAQVFFFQGKTYLLLNPVNTGKNPTVIELHGQTTSTVCTFNRRLENF